MQCYSWWPIVSNQLFVIFIRSGEKNFTEHFNVELEYLLFFPRKVVIFESTTERERQLSSSAFDGDMERSPTRHMPTQLIHPANGSDSGLKYFINF